jgi:hypothetical protein
MNDEKNLKNLVFVDELKFIKLSNDILFESKNNNNNNNNAIIMNSSNNNFNLATTATGSVDTTTTTGSLSAVPVDIEITDTNLPTHFRPIKIVQRRNSTTMEIEKVLSDLCVVQKEISVSRNNAEKLITNYEEVNEDLSKKFLNKKKYIDTKVSKIKSVALSPHYTEENTLSKLRKSFSSSRRKTF